jgi:hypothetical protein
MSSQSSPAFRPWRRFLRTSVRGLIVFILLVAAWLSWVVQNARIQRHAVAAIARVGGTVYYDWQWKNGTYLSKGQLWAPRWLVDLIGVDYFGHVTFVLVTVPPDEVDLVMSQLGCLTQLEQLGLSHSPVGDVRLARLKGLTKIKYLDLSSTRVTDDGLVNLASLRNLSTLLLRRTYVTDVGVRKLQRGLPKLTVKR